MNSTGKLRIAVLMGGKSPEHEISLASGSTFVKYLDRTRYLIRPIVVSRDDEWYVSEKFLASDDFSPQDYISRDRGSRDRSVKKMTPGRALDQVLKKEIDLVLIAMHGPFGEDGTLQGILDYIGLPYNGSGVMASALAMDKIMCKSLYQKAGLHTPDHIIIKRDEWEQNKVLIQKDVCLQFGYPCVLKVPNSGSSIGLDIPQDEQAFVRSMDRLMEEGPVMLLERHIRGREFSCGVLESPEGRKCDALPVVEIIPEKSDYFDVKAKYEKGACREIVPAEIESELTRKIQQTALTAHELLGCRTYSRSDMILSESGNKIYIMETNTLPGFTETSLLTQEALAAGMSMVELMNRVVAASLKKHGK
jgi:D-alanine-D-alanine ligase